MFDLKFFDSGSNINHEVYGNLTGKLQIGHVPSGHHRAQNRRAVAQIIRVPPFTGYDLSNGP